MTRDEQAAGNQRIAELLGWRVETFHDAKYAHLHMEHYACLFAPSGERVTSEDESGGVNGDWLNETVAWALAPDWYDSLDATVAELPDDCALLIYVRAGGQRYQAHIVSLNAEGYGEGATRAEAAAAALEALLTTQKAQQP